MLFVFGYRSNKIRSKKLSNLIHNSGNHRNVQSCTVSVYFQKIIDMVSIIFIFECTGVQYQIYVRIVVYYSTYIETSSVASPMI
jgi:chromosome segregation ATPase